MNRPTSDAMRIAFKSATRRAVEQAGGCSKVAERTRVSSSLISRYCDIQDSVFIPLDVAADIDALAGEPIIRQAWNEYCAAFQRQSAEQIQDHVTDIVTDTGKLLQTVGEGLSDGNFSPRDALNTLKAAAEAKSEITDLESKCAEVVAGV